MRAIRFFVPSIMVLLAVAVAGSLFAQDLYDTPGLVGYDPVAYFTDGKPMRGSGHHVTVHDGVTYAFTSKEHKKLFEADPQKYLPAYGGYCAYGVAVGKKIVIDPGAWENVDGETYFKLDKDGQKKRAEGISGLIKKAEGNRPRNKEQD